MSRKFAGALMIFAGAFYLLLQLIGEKFSLTFEARDYWPLIILTLGIILEAIVCATKKAIGLIVAGGFLTTIGLLFLFEAASNFRFAAYTWPVYLFGISVGLFQLYAFEKERKRLLLAAAIIAGISLTAGLIIIISGLLHWIKFGILFPIILIGAGAVHLIISIKKSAFERHNETSAIG